MDNIYKIDHKKLRHRLQSLLMTTFLDGMAIEAVLLDIGGVLLLPEPNAIADALKPTGINPSEALLHQAHHRAVAAIDQTGEKTPHSAGRSYWREYARACDVPTEILEEITDRLVDAFAKGFGWWHVVPGCREALATLANHLPIALVSNSSGEVEDALRELQLCQVGVGPGIQVATLIDSTVLGFRKPDPRIFELALSQLGVSANQVVHVGDILRSDIDGAQAVGIYPMHLDPFANCPEPNTGHDHLRDLNDLVTRMGL